jgi:gliding motility-associated-like protein
MNKTLTYHCSATILSFMLMFSNFSFSQFCDSLTPTFNVDLSADPNQTWTSPSTDRAGNCCGTAKPDRCLEFIITPHPDATSINFIISEGAVPPGSLFYQIDCGPQIPVGDPICLSDSGPITLTFCKPGGNKNEFSVVSYQSPTFGPDLITNNGCSGIISARLYNESTVTWNSVFPGTPGLYNGQLSCTLGCDTAEFASTVGLPSQIDYLVCGNDINGCLPDTICGIISAFPIEAPSIEILEDSILLCDGTTETAVTAIIDNNGQPYTLIWSTGETTATVTLPYGNHQVSVQDTASCSTISDEVYIGPFTDEPIIDAGEDQFICDANTVNLTANVENGINFLWYGGQGVFNPNNSVNTTYSPTNQELANGNVTLFFSAQSINGCPKVIDSLTIIFLSFDTELEVKVENISCFGENDGSIEVVILNGNAGPFSYSLSNQAYTDNNIFTNLAPGIYSITVVNANGCDTIIYVQVSQPAPLNADISALEMVSCFGGTDGETTVFATGGVPDYRYVWTNNPRNNSPRSTNLGAGTYSVTITDQNGCEVLVSSDITEPDTMTSQMQYDPILCSGDSTQIFALINGGTSPYTYFWNDIPGDSLIYGLGRNTYNLIVYDTNGCRISDVLTLASLEKLEVTLPADSIVCASDLIGILATTTGGNGPFTYSWAHDQFNNGNTSAILVEGDTSTNVIAVDANGCRDTAEFSATVFTIHDGDFKLSASANPVCLEDSVVLNYTYVGQTPLLSVSWNDCPSCPFPRTVYPKGDTVFTAQLITICNSTIEESIIVNVYEAPILIIQPSDTIICPGEIVQFYLKDTVLDDKWGFLWDFGTGDSSNLPSPSYSFLNSGSYTVDVQLTNPFGCVFQTDNVSNVLVRPKANSDFSSLYYERTILNPNFDFDNNSSNSSTYYWDFGDGTNSEEIDPSHTYEEAGTYEVTLIANNEFDCIDTSWNNYEIKNVINIYIPNTFTPNEDKSNNIFYVRGIGITESGYLLRIFNRWGDIIYSSNDPDQGWDGVDESTGREVPDGTYIWTVIYKDMKGNPNSKAGHVNILR